jgi:hypothetical protein
VQSAGLNVDLRVEPGGLTLQLLVQLATGPQVPVALLAVVVLDATANTVEEAPPAPVSGLPTIIYRAEPFDQLVFDNGTVRVTMSLSGLVGASWGQSFGLACLNSPPLSTLDQAVKSGSARTMGPTALESACGEVARAERLSRSA